MSESHRPGSGGRLGHISLPRIPPLFRDLADPYQSLDDVSRNHDTSLESLSAWMAHPDI